MIQVDRAPTPPALDGDQSNGGQERAEWARFHRDRDIPKPKFEAYKVGGVREALRQTFHGKCAYCESYMGHISPEDIEHFRPKGAVRVEGMTVLADGYWWLAADWGNLLTSCIFCNRLNKLEIVGVERNLTVGKGTSFPLTQEQDRASEPGGELNEIPLLLDPCRDDPENFLICLDSPEYEGLMQAKQDGNGMPNEKGDTSITIFGLNRSGLVKRRAELLAQMRLIIDDILWFIQLRTQLQGDFAVQNEVKLEERMKNLHGYTDKSKEYLLLARRIESDFIRTLVGP